MVRHVQRFRIDGTLGRGGMGEVFRAYDPQLERAVAIKIVRVHAPPADLDERRTVDLRKPADRTDDLLAEARVMARVSHPNVLSIYEAGIAEGTVFLVMELIEGIDGRGWLAGEHGRAEILEVFGQAAHGLAAAHRHGIVHRDFKPENILVGDDGRVRVCDFGLAGLTQPRDGELFRVGRQGGTPVYMAPELLRGETASARSDVYAFAVTLAEALAGERLGDGAEIERALAARRVPRRIRAMIAASLADDPEARPRDGAAITEVLDAKSRAGWIATGAGLAAVAGAALAVGLGPFGGDGPACTADPADAARWNAGRRAQLVAELAPRERSGEHTAESVVAEIDDLASRSASLRTSACRAVAAGELTAAQRDARDACFDRRWFELDARVRRIAGTKKLDVDRARAELARMRDPEDCLELLVPATTGAAHAGLQGLYARFATGTTNVAELAELERDATAAGDLELAARTAMLVADQLRAKQQFDECDATLARAQRIATDIRAHDTAARAMLARAQVAILRHDIRVANTYVELARELAERPGVRVATQVRILWGAALIADDREDNAAAEAMYRRALAIAVTADPPIVDEVLRVRGGIVGVLRRSPKRHAEALQLALETLELARATFGEQHWRHGTALIDVADVYRARSEYAAALAHFQQGVDVLSPLIPSPAKRALLQSDTAMYFVGIGDFAAARRVVEAALAHAGPGQPLAPNRAALVNKLSRALEGLGDLERARELGEEAVVASTSLRGRDHPQTLVYQRQLASRELELGMLDATARRLENVERAYNERPKDNQTHLASLALSRAELALARGNFAEAERLAREGIARYAELEMPALDRAEASAMLGEALNARARWPEAREALVRARELIAGAPRPDDAALIDAQLARAEYALGDRDTALERARSAAAVLDRFPSHRRARAALAAWLAKQASSNKR